MQRCTEHGLLNCRCREPLNAYLARQFRESGNGYVDHGQLASDAVRLDALGDRIFRRGHVGGETKR